MDTNISRPDEPSRPDVEWKRIEAEYLEKAANAYENGKAKILKKMGTTYGLNEQLTLASTATISGQPAQLFRTEWYRPAGAPTQLEAHQQRVGKFIQTLRNQAATWHTEYTGAMNAYNDAMGRYNDDMNTYNTAQAAQSKPAPGATTTP